MASPLTGQLGVGALGRFELGAWHPWATTSHHDHVRSALSDAGAGSGLSIVAGHSGLAAAGVRSLVRPTGIRSAIRIGSARGGVE